MSIVFDPLSELKKIAPTAKVKRLVRGNLTLKKAALSFVENADFIDRKSITKVALKVTRAYKKRIKNADYGEKGELRDEITSDPKLLVQRVQNEVIFQMHEKVKEKYRGQLARWLPSDADEPRPEHQANYGKTYIIGEGIDGIEPGDEPGCKCGVEILDEEGSLDLSE